MKKGERGGGRGRRGREGHADGLVMDFLGIPCRVVYFQFVVKV